MSSYREAAKEILTSSNVSRLKKLAITQCFLRGNSSFACDLLNKVPKNNILDDPESLKRKEDLFANLSELNTLEVSLCFTCRSETTNLNYNVIANLKNLTSLTLSINDTQDGSFLPKVSSLF